jgi:3-phenylpropionate/trans-cinnamate dioxygenase ferredoxin subunit
VTRDAATDDHIAEGRRARALGADELADGQGRRVDIDGERIAVVRTGDSYHAIGDRCSHANFSLAEGEIDCDDLTVECWKHGALFSLRTGEALTLPATQPVPVYDVEVEGDDVFVHLPARSDGGSRW